MRRLALAFALTAASIQLARADEPPPEPPTPQVADPVPDPLPTQVVNRLDELERRVNELSEREAATRNALEARTSPETQAAAGGGGDGNVLFAGSKGELKLAVFAQARYALSLSEGGGGEDPEVLTQGFSLRRARATMSGWAWDPRVTYQLQLEYTGAAARATDAYVQLALPRNFWVRAGQFKVPFSWEVLMSDQNMSFLERPILTDELAYDRDLGVSVGWKQVDGFLRHAEFSASAFNGAGRGAANDNRDLLLVGHGRVTIFGEPWSDEGDLAGSKQFGLAFETDVSWENAPVPDVAGTAAAPVTLNTDVDGDGRRDNVTVMQVLLGVSMRWHGLSLDFEHIFRSEDWGAIGAGQSPAYTPRESLAGGFVQAQWFVWPEHLQLGARYGQTDVSPILVQRKRSDAPVADQRTELSFLASYHRWGHGFELTLMYSFLDWKMHDDSAVTGQGEHRFILETQVAF